MRSSDELQIITHREMPYLNSFSNVSPVHVEYMNEETLRWIGEQWFDIDRKDGLRAEGLYDIELLCEQIHQAIERKGLVNGRRMHTLQQLYAIRWELFILKKQCNRNGITHIQPFLPTLTNAHELDLFTTAARLHVAAVLEQFHSGRGHLCMDDGDHLDPVGHSGRPVGQQPIADQA